jgi:DNA-binding MarR family transcriptional regulator
MNDNSTNERDLVILKHIEENPDVTQASMAAQVGVAIGTINWHLKRLIDKGYVKVRKAQRRKLRYIITPEGIALRARLTVDYIQSSFELYRLVRGRMKTVIEQVKQRGHRRIRLEGSGDVADVCRLTCVEHGIEIVEANNAPVVRIKELKMFIEWQDDEQD